MRILRYSHGSADIYYTRHAAGPRINTDTYEYSGYLTPDGKYFFFSSNFECEMDQRPLSS